MKIHEKTKVLMTADTLSGVWVYALNLMESLQNYGIEFLLATMGKPLTQHQKAELAKIENITYIESSYKLEWMDNPWQDIDDAGKWLLDLADSYQPDIVHLNSFCHGSLNWNCPCLVVGHSCVYSWFKDIYSKMPGEEWKTYFFRVSEGLKKADMVTAPTSNFLLSLKQLYGKFNTPGAVYNGSKNNFVKTEKNNSLILSAGRVWDPGKNIQILEKVCQLTGQKIYVAGNNKHPVDGTVTHYNNLQYLGFLDRTQMNKWYEKASIYILPAKYEPFGLSALEAALAGCALILGDIPSLRELWHNAAMFADPDDCKEIASAVLALENDPKLCNYYEAKSQDRAKQYSIEKMAQGYLDIYLKLMQKSTAQRRLAPTL